LKNTQEISTEIFLILEKSGLVDAVYIPEVTDIYPEKTESQHYDFDGLENEMEGKSRPGHFDGVGTVVEELFRQVKPTMLILEKRFPATCHYQKNG
jgi:pantoate--beta-alanine ligase